MINRVGLSGVIGNKVNSSTPSRMGGSSSIFGRVEDIILDENHPKFNENGGWNGIGTIYVTLFSSKSPIGNLKKAKPYSPHIKSYPLINEVVQVFLLPVPTIDSNVFKEEYYYFTSCNVWNTPHHNALPNPIRSLPDNNNISYQQVEGGLSSVVSPTPQDINLNSTSNPSQDTFIEKSNLHPLLSFAGDVIYEGRFGNSIRLGNTSKNNSSIKNDWSSEGENSDPIIILRNGQSPNITSEGWIPITENISEDLSSIYLTSTQRIKNFKVASELYSSYVTPPIPPSQFTSPQIAFNSDRIVLNAKKDSILLSSQKSIGMSTLGSVNIDASSHYISSNDIKLGSKNATQPVLLGDDTVEVLKQLAKAIKDLASILQVQRDYPGGNLTTSYNSIAGNVLEQLTNPTSGILAQLNNNSLKSKTTKVQ